MASTNEADNDPLSATLSRLSINPASFPLPESPAPQAFQKQKTNANAPDTPSQLKKPQSSRRISSIFKSQTLPRSPKIARASSASAEKHDLLGTPGVVAPQAAEPNNAQLESAAPSISAIEPRPMTAATITAESLKKELASHATSDTTSDTVVIMHDACYGHRYSRRKTTKSNLSLIVERPERIQAGVLGISTAYVRLDGKYAEGPNAPAQLGAANSNVPFIIRKTARSIPLRSSAVTNVHGAGWMEELTAMCSMTESRLATGAKELARMGTPNGTASKPHLHEGDLYLCQESLDAFQGALGGVFDGVDAVFRSDPNNESRSTTHKKAFVCIRPPGHHCSADLPSGFCWLNNVHVGIEYAAQTHGLTHAAIIDFDLHHGDGSQSITWERNTRAAQVPKNAPMSKQTAIGYFSLHDINSYPCEYGDTEKVQNASLCIENAHGQSIWNVHLQPWRTDAEFWELYRTRYAILLEKARAFLRTQAQHIRAMPANVRPKGAILISAGFDASEWEGEGMQRHKVNVPTDFYARFTADIVRLAEEDGTGVEGRIISVLEGGYSNRALTSGVLSHLTGLVGHTGASASNGTAILESSSEFPRHWWGAEAMMELEELVKGDQVPVKRVRISEPTFHATPTESFLAKVVDPAKVQRKPPILQSPNSQSPEVDWSIAAYELSKLLIPKDRQINSCRHDELAEPRIKPARQSSVGLPPIDPAGDRMQLRDRKSKASDQSDSITTDGVALPIRAPPKRSRKSLAADLPVPVDASKPLVSSNANSQPTAQAPTGKTLSAPEGSADRKTLSVGGENVPLASKASKAAQTGTKVSKTRRASGAQSKLLQEADTSKPPPVPAIPTQFGGGSRQITPQPTKPGGDPSVAQPLDSNTDIDKLAAGVKRITLKYSPKDGQKSQPKADSTSEAAPKPVKKSTAPKLPKEVSKSSSLKASKVLKAAPSMPSSTVPTTSNAPVPSMAPPQLPVASTPALPRAPTDAEPESASADAEPERASARSQLDIQRQEVASPITSASPEGTISPAHSIAPNPGPSRITAIPTTDDAGTVSEAESWIRVTSTSTSQSTPTELGALSPLTQSQSRSLHSISEDESIYATPTTHSRDPAAESPPSASPQNFVPYIPPGRNQPQGQGHAKPDALTWLPPNSDTPPRSPAKTRQLPVFTAESRIPFGAPLGPKGDEGEERGAGAGADVWEVPRTPRR